MGEGASGAKAAGSVAGRPTSNRDGVGEPPDISGRGSSANLPQGTLSSVVCVWLCGRFPQDSVAAGSPMDNPKSAHSEHRP